MNRHPWSNANVPALAGRELSHADNSPMVTATEPHMGLGEDQGEEVHDRQVGLLSGWVGGGGGRCRRVMC